MPIHVTYHSNPESELGVAWRPILPGQVSNIRDHTYGDVGILTVCCLEDDSGGEAYYFLGDRAPEQPYDNIETLQRLGLTEFVRFIEPGGRYSHDIVNASYRLARLVFHHVPSS